jgi:23S rRNA G2445 N2-methylase RlmL
MSYRHESHKRDYSDLAAGKVIYHRPGAPAFPVRLASEIFQRCGAALRAQGKQPPYTIYDPLCGTGYLLTVLGFLHGDEISKVYASDADLGMLQIAKDNLSLLTAAGLERRKLQLEEHYSAYGKASHQLALESAEKLKAMLPENIQISCFQADAARIEAEEIQERAADMVIADLPYDSLTVWKGDRGNEEMAAKTLESLRLYLDPPAVLGIVNEKKGRIQDPAYKQIKSFTLGKRRITILLHSNI